MQSQCSAVGLQQMLGKLRTTVATPLPHPLHEAFSIAPASPHHPWPYSIFAEQVLFGAGSREGIGLGAGEYAEQLFSKLSRFALPTRVMTTTSMHSSPF